MGKKDKEDRQPLTPAVDPLDVGKDPEETVPRAVMTERLARQRQTYENQLALVAGQLEVSNETLAETTTALEAMTTEKETAEGALATAKAEHDAEVSSAALSQDLTAAKGGDLDDDIKKAIVDRYNAIEGDDKPEFKTWLGEDTVAKALLGTKASGTPKVKPKPQLPDANGGGKPDSDAVIQDLDSATIQNMTIEELQANQKAIFAGDFTLAAPE